MITPASKPLHQVKALEEMTPLISTRLRNTSLPEISLIVDKEINTLTGVLAEYMINK